MSNQRPAVNLKKKKYNLTFPTLLYRLVPCERTETKLTLTAPTVTLNPKNGVWLRAEVREAPDV